MRVSIFSLAFAVALASCQSSRPPPAVSSAGVSALDWRDCVAQQTVSLATGPGSATKIAETAMELCHGVERAFTSDAIYMSPDLGIHVIPGLRVALRQDAIELVVELRARSANKPNAPRE